MDNTDLSQKINITSSIQASFQEGQGFGTVLLILNDTDTAPTVMEFLNEEDVKDAFGESSFAYKWAYVFFKQEVKPKNLKIVSKIKTDYTDTLDYIIGSNTEDNDFYLIALESTAKADILEVDAWVTAQRRFLVAQSFENENYDVNSPSTRKDLLNRLTFRTMLIGGLTAANQKTNVSFTAAIVTGESIKVAMKTRDGIIKIETAFDTDELTTLGNLTHSLMDQTDDVLLATVNLTTHGVGISMKNNRPIVFLKFVKVSATGVETAATVTEQQAMKWGDDSRIDAAFLSKMTVVDTGTRNPAWRTFINVNATNYTSSQLQMINTYMINGYIAGNYTNFFSGITFKAGHFFDTVQLYDELEQRIKERLANHLKGTEAVFLDQSGLSDSKSEILHVIGDYALKGLINLEKVVVNIKKESEITDEENLLQVLRGTTIEIPLVRKLNKYDITLTIVI